MKVLTEYILTVWAYLAIALVTLTLFPIELFLFVVLFPFDKQRYYVGRLFRLSSVISTKLNPMWDFSVVGKLPEKIPQRTVFVSNHRSLADSALISYLPWEMKWLSKASMFLVPFIGWSMWLAGDISLHRGDRDSAKGAMGKCREWLEKGANVMIFPEVIECLHLTWKGTRSRDGKMGEFKDGAFRLAIESKSPVIPLAVAGTDECIAVGTWRMSTAKGVVAVGKPIPTENMTVDDIQLLKTKVVEQIVTMVKELTPLTKTA